MGHRKPLTAAIAWTLIFACSVQALAPGAYAATDAFGATQPDSPPQSLQELPAELPQEHWQAVLSADLSSAAFGGDSADRGAPSAFSAAVGVEGLPTADAQPADGGAGSLAPGFHRLPESFAVKADVSFESEITAKRYIVVYENDAGGNAGDTPKAALAAT